MHVYHYAPYEHLDYDTPSRNPDVATTDAYTATLTFVLK